MIITGSCTNQKNGLAYVEQKWRNCFTCDATGSNGVCIPCSKKCHVNHKLGPILIGNFFCDCGAGAIMSDESCMCYTLTGNDMIIRTITKNTSSLPISAQSNLLTINGFYSPHAIFLALGLISQINECPDMTKELTGGNDVLLTYSPEIDGAQFAIGLFGTNTKSVILNPNMVVDRRKNADVINTFVSSKTNGQITKVIDSDFTIGQVCVSAISFNRQWSFAFNPEHNTEMNFTGENGTVSIPAMRRLSSDSVGTVLIRDDVFFSIFLTYANDSHAILTIPTSPATDDYNYTIKDLILINKKLYMDHVNFKNTKIGRGNVTVPKFRKEFTIDNLINELDELGLDELELEERTGINEIIHKVMINFDEQGRIEVIKTQGPILPDFEWIANIPYALAIVDKSDPNRNGTLLFSGIIDHSCE